MGRLPCSMALMFDREMPVNSANAPWVSSSRKRIPRRYTPVGLVSSSGEMSEAGILSGLDDASAELKSIFAQLAYDFGGTYYTDAFSRVLFRPSFC